MTLTEWLRMLFNRKTLPHVAVVKYAARSLFYVMFSPSRATRFHSAALISSNDGALVARTLRHGGSVVWWLGHCTRDFRSRIRLPAMILSGYF